MEIAAVVISLVSLIVATVGTALANKRAKEAIEESRKAAASALWASVQEAIQRMIGFDPASEPIGDRLVNLRIAMIALVDEMHDWAGLDKWLEAERTLGALLGRQVMERTRRGDSVDERLKILDPYQRWAQVLGSNLRRFRAVGYDPGVAAKLHDHAESHIKQVCEANGWAIPPPGPAGIRETLINRPAWVVPVEGDRWCRTR